MPVPGTRQTARCVYHGKDIPQEQLLGSLQLLLCSVLVAQVQRQPLCPICCALGEQGGMELFFGGPRLRKLLPSTKRGEEEYAPPGTRLGLRCGVLR